MKNTIIITGANGNVGAYLAHRYAGQNKKLILILHKQSNRLKDLYQNENIRFLHLDLANIEETKNNIDNLIRETNWKPTKLIHTATIRSHDFKPLVDTDPKLWSEIINTNIVGTFNLLKTVLPYFRENHYGKIVLFGSNVTRIGLPKGSAYAASKAAIANLGRTLAAEEARNNIIVNTVSPGPIKIDDSSFSESYRKFRREYYKEKKREIPLKRCATFDDLFGICSFLLSEENSYITGEEFYITGGKL
jgi:3-oxoacyl-[acyl-carrier protein] reductase